ncbi:unnamed protein product [Paramecium pentaurelia]|uniref:Protein-methionine-S-oxide reductase n=1 Tax=Paramecium pentaurelia TaxID=43138 RepID=A0A8S1U736_9CILI|nr:unnamed protein product [Paramecium pentaurelia]
MEQTKKILIGGGCFWKHELNMQRLIGVIHTEVGYSGGIIDHPCYKLICTGQTNHAEVVLVHYDQSVIKLEDLLYSFFNQHDPTQLNRQGLDVGTQYRSCIFYYDDEDVQVIQKVLEEVKQFNNDETIHTQVAKVKNYWKAEEMHQRYLQKAGQSAEKGCEDIIMCYN